MARGCHSILRRENCGVRYLVNRGRQAAPSSWRFPGLCLHVVFDQRAWGARTGAVVRFAVIARGLSAGVICLLELSVCGNSAKRLQEAGFGKGTSPIDALPSLYSRARSGEHTDVRRLAHTHTHDSLSLYTSWGSIIFIPSPNPPSLALYMLLSEQLVFGSG